jgi:hypothetical protein
MKKAPLEMGEYNYYEGSYSGLVESANLEILVDESDDDYQGDSMYLVRDKDTGQFGFITFGWGSCSGCDALQACDTVKDLEELRDSLVDGVAWNTLKAVTGEIQAKDWSTLSDGQDQARMADTARGRPRISRHGAGAPAAADHRRAQSVAGDSTEGPAE